MAEITDLMEELNYPTDPKGVCQGIAFMAEKARDCGEYDKFVKRINLLNKLENNVLNKIINNAKIKQRNGILLTSDEKVLLTVEAFFFQVWAHQEPDAIRKFLDIEDQVYCQEDSLRVEELMYGSAESDKQTLLNQPTYFNLKIPDETLEDALFLFLHTIRTSDFSLGLIISHNKHAVHLFYDNKNEHWLLTDHTFVSTIPSEEEVELDLINAFTIDASSEWRFRIFSRETKKTTILLGKLIDLSLLPQVARGKTNFDELNQAVLNNNTSEVITMLHSGYFFWISSEHATDIVHTAVKNNRKDIIVLLLEHPKFRVDKKALTLAKDNGHAAIYSLVEAYYIKRKVGNKGLITGFIAGALIGAGGAVLIDSFFGGVSCLPWTLIGAIAGGTLEKAYGFLNGFYLKPYSYVKSLLQRSTSRSEQFSIEENKVSPQNNPYLHELLSSESDKINSFPLENSQKRNHSGAKFGETKLDYDHKKSNFENLFKPQYSSDGLISNLEFSDNISCSHVM